MTYLQGFTREIVPPPSSAEDSVRWSVSRRNRRMLTGQWKPDLELRALQRFGPDRRGVIGPVAYGKNLFKRLCEELAVLYVETPRPKHAAGLKLQGFLSDVRRGDEVMLRALMADPWPMMRRVQVFTLGQREHLIRLSFDASRMRLSFRTVYADMVCAEARVDAPQVPVKISEMRWFPFRDRAPTWAWEHLDISDPGNPRWWVEAYTGTDKRGEDITPHVLGRTSAEVSGKHYPFRWKQGLRAGQPFLPYVLYAADQSDQLFNPFEWQELVEGALDIATKWTFFDHCVFNASWPQRYAVGAYVEGTRTEQTVAGRRSMVPVDPTSLLHLRQDGTQQAQIGQWAPSVNILELQQAISAYEKDMTTVAGVDAANIVRDSGDAWSGAALSISRDGKREAQRVYTPLFQPRDEEMMEKAAAITNAVRILPYELPEQGYRQVYGTIPLSMQELTARRENNDALIDRGRLSPVEAWMNEHPGSTLEEAEAELERIARDRTRFAAPAPPAPSPAPAPAQPAAA